MFTQVHVAVNLNPRASAAGIMEMPMVEIDQVSLWYGDKQALKDVSMSVPKHRVTAYIGPSGCGKTTLLRCLNRMNDLVDGVRMAGNIRIGGTDIHDPTLDVTELRKRGRAGRAAHGRALLGARSDRHRQDRGTDARTQEQLHDRHRDPQHAAG